MMAVHVRGGCLGPQHHTQWGRQESRQERGGGNGYEGQGKEGEGCKGRGKEGEGCEGRGKEGEGCEEQAKEGEGYEGKRKEGKSCEGKEGERYDGQGKEGEGCEGQGKERVGCEGQGKVVGCGCQGKGVRCGWQGKGKGSEEVGGSRALTPLEKLNYDAMHDEKTIKEVTLGRRIGFYQLRGQIGSGNFSQVKLGIHVLTKEKVAIKILDKSKLDQKTERLLSREIASMERLHHPHIIRLYEVMETLTRLHLVLEYAAGGELFTSVSTEGPLPEDLARKLFAQIVSAVQHMHDNAIIHRDLKAENVFLCGRGCVKVGDFGFSTASGRDERLDTFCGSPPYAAPELFRDERYRGAAVDVWALGVLLFFMLAGAVPFRADTVSKLKHVILQADFRLPDHVSGDGQRLIRAILQPEPGARCSLAAVARSDWLRGEELPEAHAPFRLEPRPPAQAGPLHEVEAEVWAGLRRLGVTERHVLHNQGQSSRSAITGLYRILLHRAQRRRELPATGRYCTAGRQGAGSLRGSITARGRHSHSHSGAQATATARGSHRTNSTAARGRHSGSANTNTDSKPPTTLTSKLCSIL